MKPPVRRALAVGAVIVALVAIGVAATGWYLLAEERRMGRMIGSLLSGRTGLPITVDRATTDGFRLTLRGVRVAASADLRASRLEITGGVMPLVAPAGREVTVVATSASVTLPPGAAGGAVPDASTLEGLRARALALMAWPGVLSLRMLGGELRSGGQVYPFDLTFDKTAGGQVLATLALSRDGEPSIMRLDARASAGGAGALALAIDLAAQPARLGALWPAGVPAPASVAARGDLAVATGGDLSTTSRLTVAMEHAPPALLDLVARYDARAGSVTVSRYTLTREDGIRLEGTARSETVNGVLRLAAEARGTVDGSRLETRLSYALADGAFAGQAEVAPLTTQSVWRRLGLGAPPTQASARAVSARFSGANGAGGLNATVDATFSGLESASAPRFPVDGSLAAAARFTRDERGLTLAAVERSTLTLRRERTTVAVVSARSKTPSAAWPMAVDANVADLSRVTPLFPVPVALAGSAHVTGDVAYTSGATFAGTMDAHVASATLTLGSPVVATNVWAALPLRWGAGPGDTTGTVSAERVTAYGILLERLTGSGRIVDGRLLLPDLRYIHYDGRGSGWLEALTTSAGVDFSTRLEGEDVDLAAAARASGVTAGRVSGRVRYVIAAQYAPARGLSALGRATSQEGGGEVSIDAIERLLESPAVQVESTGLLRRTLQNLKTFQYASLESDVRIGGGTGYIDLSLKGKKRLGIFPGPVEAINFRNVPLAVLARTLDRGSTP